MVFKNLKLCKIDDLLFVVQKINCVHLIKLVFSFSYILCTSNNV